MVVPHLKGGTLFEILGGLILSRKSSSTNKFDYEGLTIVFKNNSRVCVQDRGYTGIHI